MNPDIITAGRRLPSLTGMRFLAALLVFLYHAADARVFTDPRVADGLSAALGKAGTVGVSFFFVLSGFVLTWTARPGDTARRFWRRRAAKILPNHVVTWAVVLVLVLLGGRLLDVGTALVNLLLLHAWVPSFPVLFSLNDVSWSLSCELFFYLAFPLLLPLISRIRPSRLWAWAGGVMAAVVCVPLVAELLPGPAGLDIYSFWLVYALPPVRCLEFVMGILMARIVLSGRWVSFIGLVPAGLLAVAGYLLALWVPQLYGVVAATLVPLALVVPAAAVADLEGRRSPFRGTVAVWLGEVSFAFYMVHRMVLNFGHLALGPERTWGTPVAVTLLVAALLVAVGLAAALHALVERPAMHLIAGSARKDGPASSDSPATDPKADQATEPAA